MSQTSRPSLASTALRSRLPGALAVALALVVGVTGAVAPAAAAERRLARPALEVETASDGLNRVRVETRLADGTRTGTVLRETTSAVTPRATGSDPAGRAVFATWDEAGTERWHAFSRDGGASWSEARPLALDIRLRDGAVTPGVTMPPPRQGFALPAGGKLFLVQFKTIGLPEWRAALASLGAELLNHVPHNAHIVRMSPALVPAARGLDFVERVEPYHPWYRIDPRLRDWLDGTGPKQSATTLRVNMMALEWGLAARKRIARSAESLGVTVVENWPNGQIVQLEVSREQLRALTAHDDVLWVDPWGGPENDMDIVREDAGTNWVETNFNYCGQDVRGEVLDGGIEDTHMDFDGIIVHGGNSSSSHGTNTYGIVFGNGDRDGDGQAKGTGHMPCASAQGIAADYDFLGDRFAHTQELKQNPYFASFQTNSWGDPRTFNYTSVSSQMDDIIWRLDFAILQSQSNSGTQDSRPQAWAKNIISVGGVYHNDTLSTADDAWSGGASIGPAEDGRIKPDVSYWYDDIYTTTTGNGYTTSFGGTSGATPESAGVVGLIVQMWADNVWETDPEGTTVFEKRPHASTIKALLVNNAQQYDFTGPTHDLTRVHQGWGRPSARVAKERAATSFVVNEEVQLELDDFSLFDVDVQAGESELKVTMVYPDPPGTTSASLHRINNVDLKVTSPSLVVYHGNNGLLDGTESTAGGVANDLDTVENVFVKNPEAGVWKVEITATEINQDGYLDTPDVDVTYALVITGGTSQLIQPFDGRVRLNRDVYGCAQTIGVRVIDGNVGASTLNIDIRSDTESTAETLLLTETKPGSGKYSGSIATTPGPASAGDGLLSIAHGDSIDIDYIDADDGAGGNNLLRVDSATGDCQAPIISSVGEQNVTGASATVVWTTDELADSEVVWGETIPPTQSSAGFGDTTNHQIALTGLNECTLYYYEVRSGDDYGNDAADDSGGNYYHFETLGDFGAGLQPCHAGQVSLGSSVYSCSDTVTFEVVDLDLNLDSLVADTVTLSLSSSTETLVEEVVATETGPNTSVFAGSIATTNGAPVPDGLLQLAHEDVITVTYRDQDDGSGSPSTSFVVAAADCGGPRVSDLAVSSITDARATISWNTEENSDTVVEWGPTAALGNVSSSGTPTTVHSLTFNQFDTCQTVYFRVSSTDAYGNTTVADVGGQPFSFHTWEIPGLYHFDDFEAGAPGWTLQGEWEVGAPTGAGGSSGLADPAGAYNNSGVLGQDLSGQGVYPGDYEPGTTESAFTPVMDGTSWTNTRLIYYRRLNTGQGDPASAWLTTNGVGRPIYNNSGSASTESSFEAVSLDIGVFADGASTVQVEFRQTADASGQYSGFNLDDVIFKDASLPDYAACRNCGAAPSFAGATSAFDNDACGSSGITVTWDPAVAWGSGGAGTYAVYRDSSPGFTPSGANLVASGLVGGSHLDATAPPDTTSYYLVLAENDESCGTGPNNGGEIDANQAYVAVGESTSSPPAAAVTGLDVQFVNFAHVLLSWDAATSATTYRVYRSESPDVGFIQLAETSDLNFEDANQGGNANSYYYLVKGINACGVEGP